MAATMLRVLHLTQLKLEQRATKCFIEGSLFNYARDAAFVISLS